MSVSRRLKEEARRQRTLTLENDEVGVSVSRRMKTRGGKRSLTLENDEVVVVVNDEAPSKQNVLSFDYQRKGNAQYFDVHPQRLIGDVFQVELDFFGYA